VKKHFCRGNKWPTKITLRCPVRAANTYNPSYSGGRD
jgi:hypothetical protein